MILMQSRFVTDDVVTLAAFYARLVGADTTLNEYYVEVRAGGASVAFSKSRFTEFTCPSANSVVRTPVSGEVILDFKVDDIDAEFIRIDEVGVEWVMKPTTQPWGARAMTFRDPHGNLVNVFSPNEGDDA